MPESLARLLEQFQDSWSKLPRQAKLIIPVVAIVILVALIALGFWSGNEEYVTLFSNLSERDIGLIEAELTQMNHVFKTQGSEVSVPMGTESQIRMFLAQRNLPRVGDAYDIFKETNLGDTFLDFDRKYQQMTEAKIRNAIESLEPVQFADVNITPMVDSPFAVDKRPAKAVVMLRLHADRILSHEQVNGVRHLVASSVKGLAPEDVKVIDSKGFPMDAAPQTSEADLKMEGALRRLEYESKIAAEKERKIKLSLAPLVGGEQYVQAVLHVEADFDNQNRDEVIYNPNELAPEEIPVETQTSIKEKTKGPWNTGLPPGTASNVTGSGQIALGNQDVEVERDSTEVKNLVSRRTVTLETAPGKIKRLTATAIIDYKKAYVDGALQYTPWTPEETLELEKTVRNAVGFDAVRGDSVSVMPVKFDNTVQTQVEKHLADAKLQDTMKEIAKAVSVAVVGIIIWLLLRSVFRTMRVDEVGAIEAGSGTEGMPLGVETRDELPGGVLDEKRTPLKGEPISAFPGAVEDTEAGETPEAKEMHRLQEEISEMVRTNPDTVALILRNWLSEDEDKKDDSSS